MKWHWLLMIAFMTTLISGCGTGETDVVMDESMEDPDAPLVVGPVPSLEASDVPEEVLFQPPFPSNRSFFRQPEPQTVVVETEGDLPVAGSRVRVRVIGFSQIEDSDPQALIEVGGSLESVRSGNSINGVTVVSVNAPNVTFQHRSEQWTVALSSKSLVRSEVAMSSQRRDMPTRRSRLISNGDFRGNVHRNSYRESGADKNLPPAPTSLPTENDEDIAALPDDLDLPEPPVLPDMETSLDDPLPGLDEIPQLPEP